VIRNENVRENNLNFPGEDPKSSGVVRETAIREDSFSIGARRIRRKRGSRRKNGRVRYPRPEFFNTTGPYTDGDIGGRVQRQGDHTPFHIYKKKKKNVFIPERACYSLRTPPKSPTGRPNGPPMYLQVRRSALAADYGGNS